MAEHILITCSTRRPYRTTPDISDCTQYDPTRGYWIRDGLPLVDDDESSEGKRVTKKCDLETGEDQKGT